LSPATTALRVRESLVLWEQSLAICALPEKEEWVEITRVSEVRFASGDPFTKFQIIVHCRAVFVFFFYLPANTLRVNWTWRKGVKTPA